MKVNTNTVIIVGGISAGLIATVYISRGIGNAITTGTGNLTTAGSGLSNGLQQGINNLTNNAGQVVKGLSIGGGVAVLAALLLPPPLDIIGIVVGIGSAVVIGDSTPTVVGSVTVSDTPSSGTDLNVLNPQLQ
jgi:hypothetical protein